MRLRVAASSLEVVDPGGGPHRAAAGAAVAVDGIAAGDRRTSSCSRESLTRGTYSSIVGLYFHGRQ